jgi:hypothetical protein
MDRFSSLLAVAGRSHAGAVVFAVGVGLLVLIAVYLTVKGRH